MKLEWSPSEQLKKLDEALRYVGNWRNAYSENRRMVWKSVGVEAEMRREGTQ